MTWTVLILRDLEVAEWDIHSSVKHGGISADSDFRNCVSCCLVRLFHFYHPYNTLQLWKFSKEVQQQPDDFNLSTRKLALNAKRNL
jgi:hypothetical protein